MAEIALIVKKLLIEKFGINDNEITLETLFIKGFAVDSLALF